MNVGIDIVAVNRIDLIYKKFGKRFLERIFTDKEIKEIETISNYQRKILKIAGKFAAKEAIFKVDNSLINFKKIEILTNLNGSPEVTGMNIKVSISHEKEYAVAVALKIIQFKPF